LGRVVLLPGLVNAHCHLELTALAGAIPPGTPFVDWIRRVIALKAALSPADFARSAADGARRLLASGTTTVADNVSQDGAVEALAAVPIRKIVLWETLGIGAKADAGVARIRGRLSQSRPGPLTSFGVAPHAPYSTGRSVYKECVALAKAGSLPLSTHLAETTEEIEFLDLGSGPLRDLLDDMQLLPDDYRPERRSPLEFLASVGGLCERTLIAHMNHPGRADPALLAESGASVVYCPGTHAYFGRGRHPFRDLLDAGVNVCLGTDSLASNRTLSILDEMRSVARANRSLWPQVVLKAGTINGATALGMGDSVGALVPGGAADMIAVPLRPGGSSDPVENLLASDAHPVWVMVAGEVVAGSGAPAADSPSGGRGAESASPAGVEPSEVRP
jgi:cytosine/adenosine deaminase-related metal-dependent hydrolase